MQWRRVTQERGWKIGEGGEEDKEASSVKKEHSNAVYQWWPQKWEFKQPWSFLHHIASRLITSTCRVWLFQCYEEKPSEATYQYFASYLLLITHFKRLVMMCSVSSCKTGAEKESLLPKNLQIQNRSLFQECKTCVYDIVLSIYPGDTASMSHDMLVNRHVCFLVFLLVDHVQQIWSVLDNVSQR